MPHPSFTDLEKHLSSQRLQRYVIACSGDDARALQLYKANLKIAQSFHPLLGLLEVVLRNQINLVLSTHFSDNDWVINQRTGFMSDLSLARSRFYLRTEVDNAINRLSRKRVRITSGKVIADLHFGFWTALFETYHYSLLRGKPIHIFPKLPPRHGRKEVLDALTLIREFRNRTNHNEPICFRANTIDFSETVKTYKAVHRMFRWIDVRLIDWLRDVNQVFEEIGKAKLI